MKRLLAYCAALSFLAGLGGSGCAPTDKGAESPLPAEGAADSFAAPTDHGALSFGVPSAAAFEDGSLFHAWTFALGAEAQVRLEVQPGASNLDTVMYLYRRAPGAASWGTYIARNDDLEGHPWSGLSLAMSAGEYRVLIKGYKTSLRGAFHLSGECAGGGCPSTECPAEMAELPAATGFGASCLAKIESVLLGAPAVVAAVTVSEQERCRHEETARLAFDYYLSYFDREELAEMAEDPENLELEVTVTGFGGRGWLAEVTAGGDEDRLTLVLDVNRRLLAYFQDNQSPDIGWFCLDPSEPEVEVSESNYFCVGNYLDLVRAPAAPAVDSSGTVRVDATGSLAPLLQAVVAQYAAEGSLGATASVSYQASSWSEGSLLRATLSAEHQPTVTYLAGTDGYSSYVYTATTGDAARLVCTEPSL